MNDQERLDALLVRYEELRAGQTPVSAAALCHDCPELLAALERQIADLESMNALLGAGESKAPSGATPEFGPVPSAPAAAAATEDLATGSHFHLLRLHARGGLGEVHLARDEGLHREVALKRLQPLHAHNPESRRRFLREAEITSRLEHPSIVPVHAVGDDAEGRPFYTMRFVQGQTLLEALQEFHGPASRSQVAPERRLALRQLLGRFVAVCNTVAYAHSQGVLHRDIKPANILLGKYGETLLLDWGLARRFTSPETEPAPPESPAPAVADAAEATHPGAVLGTPAYMSPEQAAGRTDALGPASDVYSLGATLYALLTGEPPFRDSHVGLLLDKVQHGDFPLLRQQNHDIPRALEAICLKAMARPPEQRYATALELATDLEHWLAGEPVQAWREPWRMRVGRWVRRHRLKVAAGVAALGMAVICLGVASWFLLAAYRDTEAQRDAARDERDKAQQRLRLASAAVDQLTQFATSTELKTHGLELLQKKMATASVEFYQQIVREAADNPEYQAQQGRAYRQLGLLSYALDHNAQAEEALQQARDIFAQLVEADPRNLEHRRYLALCHNHLGLLYKVTGRTELAEQAYRQARDTYAQVVRDCPDVPIHQAALAKCTFMLGYLYADTGKHEQAEQAYHQALEVQQRLADAHPQGVVYQRDLADTLTDLGILYRATESTGRAEPLWQKARAIRQRLADDHPEDPLHLQYLARADNNLALIYSDTGRPMQAEEAYRRAQSSLERLVRTHPHVPSYEESLAACHTNLSVLYRNTARPDLAVEAGRQAQAIFQRLADAHPEVVRYTVTLAGCFLNQVNLLSDRDQNEEAVACCDQAIARLQPVLQKSLRLATGRAVLVRLHGARAAALAKLGRHTEAAQSLHQAADIGEDQKDSMVPYYRAFVLVRAGDHVGATAAAREAAAMKTILPRGLFEMALPYAQAVPLAHRDGRLTPAERTRLGESYAASALALLRRAQAAGFFTVAAVVERLRDHPDLAPLRTRPDFQALVRELEEKTKAAPPAP